MIKINYNFKHADQKLGKHCFIYRGPEVDKIKEAMGRGDQDLCLKVFYNQDKPGNWGDDPKSKESTKKNATIKEATIIQNICHYEGLAPRVYGLTKVSWTGVGRQGKEAKDKICEAQITDDLGRKHTKTNEEALKVYEQIIKLGEKYGWKVNFKESKRQDLFQGKFVDFQSLNLTDDYEKKIKDLIYEYGKWGKTHYQAIPELGIKTFRKTEQRIKELKLDKIDFKGKRVLDIGCSSGVFCNYAASRGAKRVIGIDLEKPVMASRLLANHLGYLNNDYYILQIFKNASDEFKKIIKFDITLFLSMLYHIGYPDWLSNITNEICIIEWNHWQKKDGLSVEECESKTFEMLKKDFSKIVLVGRATDHGDKAIFHCWK